nr:recombinase family protein [Falsirhodobacter halotolerans]
MTRSPLRAAIYARYSSDLQSAASIQDQVRLCQKLCQDNGWEVAEVFADEAMSGASHLRPGFQDLQQAAMNGHIDVVVAEAMDRLSRDQEHIAGFHKRMAYYGVKIITKSEGEINEMHIGLGGTMSALFLKQLAQKTHRGLEGRVRQGMSGGGISYGYRVRKGFHADGSVVTGERDIDPEEAEIVRRIFTDYDSGLSSRSIAAALNAEGIPAPRSGGKGDGRWGFSTISGNWKRGTGILNNELYIGFLVWNRQRFIKDPDTGKRQARLNPTDSWIVTEVPEQRIIEDDLWQRVKARQTAIREEMNPAGVQTERPHPERGRRPDYLLSGLICCDATYTLINKTRYGCSASRNKGGAACTNRATIERAEVEARVLGGLKERLLHPELIVAFVEEYRRAFNAAAGNRSADRTKAERELAQIDRKIAGILSAIEDGMYHPSMKAKMEGLEVRKTELTRSLAETPEPPALRLHPSLGSRYRSEIARLSEALQAPGMKREATEILRGLISEVRMIPEAGAPGGHRMELVGDLAGILRLAEDGALPGPQVRVQVKGGSSKCQKPRRLAGVGCDDESETMVAGVGFEPTTFRL